MVNSGQRQPRDKNTVFKTHSKTKVHFSESAVYKYLSGRREPISIRIDTGLYSAFKPLSKRVYGSTCKAIEVYMISFIEAVETGVHFSDTVKPIQIENIVIERKLSERRNLEIDGTVQGGKRRIRCGFARCRNEAVGKAIWLKDNREVKVCSMHLRVACSDRKLWKVV